MSLEWNEFLLGGLIVSPLLSLSTTQEDAPEHNEADDKESTDAREDYEWLPEREAVLRDYRSFCVGEAAVLLWV